MWSEFLNISFENALPFGLKLFRLEGKTMKSQGIGQLRMWGGRFLWVIGAAVWLSLMAGAWSRADAAGRDEYNFSWLDPDKKIYVLQNRKFTKAGRVMVSALGGVGWSNPYRSVLSVEPRVAVYFKEDLGVEIFYSKMFNSDSNSFKSLQSASPTTFPTLREFQSQIGAMGHWVPWYAKINVFNQILYFDWGFGFGLSQLSSDRLEQTLAPGPIDKITRENHIAAVLSTFQHFYLGDHWSVRLDLNGAFYSATYKVNSGDKTWFSNFQFGAGLGYRL